MKPTISLRIVFGYALLLALAVGMGAYSLYQMAELRRIQATVAERDLHVLDLIQDISQSEGTMRGFRERAVSNALLDKDKLLGHDPRAVQTQWRQTADQAEKQMAELEATTGEYEKSAMSPRRQEQWGKIRQNARESRTAWKVLVADTARPCSSGSTAASGRRRWPGWTPSTGAGRCSTRSWPRGTP